jgi:hypothetical protein
MQMDYSPMRDEQAVLNFALNLEHLEAEFYTYAISAKSITSFGVGIKGLATGANPTECGVTVGGKQVCITIMSSSHAIS